MAVMVKDEEGLVISRMDRPRGLRFAGDLDLAAAHPVETMLRREIENGGSLAVDLQEVTFLESTALLAFIRAARELAARGDELVVMNPSEAVRRVVALTGFARFPGVRMVS